MHTYLLSALGLLIIKMSDPSSHDLVIDEGENKITDEGANKITDEGANKITDEGANKNADEGVNKNTDEEINGTAKEEKNEAEEKSDTAIEIAENKEKNDDEEDDDDDDEKDTEEAAEKEEVIDSDDETKENMDDPDEKYYDYPSCIQFGDLIVREVEKKRVHFNIPGPKAIAKMWEDDSGPSSAYYPSMDEYTEEHENWRTLQVSCPGEDMLEMEVIKEAMKDCNVYNFLNSIEEKKQLLHVRFSCDDRLSHWQAEFAKNEKLEVVKERKFVYPKIIKAVSRSHLIVYRLPPRFLKEEHHEELLSHFPGSTIRSVTDCEETCYACLRYSSEAEVIEVLAEKLNTLKIDGWNICMKLMSNETDTQLFPRSVYILPKEELHDIRHALYAVNNYMRDVELEEDKYLELKKFLRAVVVQYQISIKYRNLLIALYGKKLSQQSLGEKIYQQLTNQETMITRNTAYKDFFLLWKTLPTKVKKFRKSIVLDPRYGEPIVVPRKPNGRARGTKGRKKRLRNRMRVQRRDVAGSIFGDSRRIESEQMGRRGDRNRNSSESSGRNQGPRDRKYDGSGGRPYRQGGQKRSHDDYYDSYDSNRGDRFGKRPRSDQGNYYGNQQQGGRYGDRPYPNRSIPPPPPPAEAAYDNQSYQGENNDPWAPVTSTETHAQAYDSSYGGYGTGASYGDTTGNYNQQTNNSGYGVNVHQSSGWVQYPTQWNSSSYGSGNSNNQYGY